MLAYVWEGAGREWEGGNGRVCVCVCGCVCARVAVEELKDGVVVHVHRVEKLRLCLVPLIRLRCV